MQFAFVPGGGSIPSLATLADFKRPIMEHLIPDAPFVTLPVAVLLGITACAMWGLAKGADWLVDGASELAQRLGVPKIVVGATIVSLGTTAPECAVSVMAAWQGDAGLALGNAVGSVIFDTAVIFGGGAVLVTLPADRFLLKRQGWVQFGSAALLAGLCYFQYYRYGDEAVVPQWMGVLLLGLLLVYMAVSLHWSRQHAGHAEAEPIPHDEGASTLTLLGKMALGLILILLGSRLTIVCVTIIARRLSIPEVVISATIVAVGTSLPECIVGLTAIRKGHPELLVGNVVGADILNILFVAGAAALAKDLPIVDPLADNPLVFLTWLLPVMLISLGYFRICIALSTRRGHFQRWMGIPLLILYIAFTLMSLTSVSTS